MLYDQDCRIKIFARRIRRRIANHILLLAGFVPWQCLFCTLGIQLLLPVLENHSKTFTKAEENHSKTFTKAVLLYGEREAFNTWLTH